MKLNEISLTTITLASALIFATLSEKLNSPLFMVAAFGVIFLYWMYAEVLRFIFQLKFKREVETKTEDALMEIKSIQYQKKQKWKAPCNEIEDATVRRQYGCSPRIEVDRVKS